MERSFAQLKIVCQRNILLENINIVSKAVSSKSTLQILECILLKTDEFGFKLISNDLELGIETSTMEATVIEEGTVALEAKIFSEIIRKLPNDNVTITVDDNNVTHIECGKVKFKILGQSGNEFPYLPDVEKNKYYSISKMDFKNIIKQTLFAVSQDDIKPALTGELIQIKDGYLNIVAVDGFRIAYRQIKVDEEGDEVSIIVPSKALSEISKILSSDEEGNINMYFTDKHVLFDLQSCIVVSRLISGEFIKYEQTFTDEFTTVVHLKTEEFIMSLERASLISREAKKNPVVLKVENDKIIVTSNTEFGNSYDEIISEVLGNNIEIAFNPKYLLDAAKATDDEKISIYFNTPLSPCIIKNMEESNYKYLVLPLRLGKN